MTARERISYTLRILVSYTLYYAGVLQLLQRVRLRGKAVVLMYHRVLTPEQQRQTGSQEGLVVSDATFARHVALLRQMFDILTLDQFEQRLARREPFARPSCLITFDDGWIDNYQNAWPVLRSHNVPALMFLPVNFIGQKKLFVREALTHLLVAAVKRSRRDPATREALRPHLIPIQLARVLDIAADDPLPEVRRAIGAHRYASGPEFEAVVAVIARELGLGGADLTKTDGFINWDQVVEMAQNGFTFGGHGADHRVLTQVPPDTVRCEVEYSKQSLERRLGTPATAFAYPNGAWSASVAATVKAAGYRLAFTIEPGPVTCQDDIFALRRVNIHEGMTRSRPMFLARLTGLL